MATVRGGANLGITWSRPAAALLLATGLLACAHLDGAGSKGLSSVSTEVAKDAASPASWFPPGRWDPNFGRALLDGGVSSMAWDGDRLLVGGNFKTVAGLPADGVAVFDTSTGAWAGLGLPRNAGGVSAVAALDGAWFAYRVDRGLERWRDGRWVLEQAPLGPGIQVRALVATADGVFAAGTMLGSTRPLHPVMLLDSKTGKWRDPAEPIPSFGAGSDYATSLALGGGHLLVGGQFGDHLLHPDYQYQGIVELERSATAWRPLGRGLASGEPLMPSVSAVAVEGESIYAAGTFTLARDGDREVPVNRVARWDRRTGRWIALGAGVSEFPSAIAVSQGHVFVAGSFIVAGTGPAFGAAHWDPTMSAWEPLGSGLQSGPEVVGQGTAVTVHDGWVYFAGHFSNAGGVAVTGLARWCWGGQTRRCREATPSRTDLPDTQPR